MSFRWQTTPTQAIGQLVDAQVIAVHTLILVLAERYVPRIEAWMKQNAPWQDITANARQSLFADVVDVANSAVVILMGHGVEYGTFLELAHGGRYSILGPALDHFIPLIWRDVQNLLRP